MKKQLTMMLLFVAMTFTAFSQCPTVDTTAGNFEFTFASAPGADSVNVFQGATATGLTVLSANSTTLITNMNGLNVNSTYDSIQYFLGGVKIGITCIIPGQLPVELTSFTVNATDDINIINWVTASELNNEGFEVYKSYDGKNWNFIGYVTGMGTIQVQTKYNFNDFETKTCYYQLKQIDYDGKFEYSEIIKSNRIVREIYKVRIFNRGTGQEYDSNNKSTLPASYIMVIEYTDKTLESRIVSPARH